MSLFANFSSEFLHDRLGRWLKLFVSTDGPSSHEFASQFGLAIFYTRKTPKHYREDRISRPVECLLNEQASAPSKTRVMPVTVSLSVASDNMSDDNSDHSGDRLSQNGEKQQVQIGTSLQYDCPDWVREEESMPDTAIAIYLAYGAQWFSGRMPDSRSGEHRHESPTHWRRWWRLVVALLGHDKTKSLYLYFAINRDFIIIIIYF